MHKVQSLFKGILPVLIGIIAFIFTREFLALPEVILGIILSSIGIFYGMVITSLISDLITMGLTAIIVGYIAKDKGSMLGTATGVIIISASALIWFVPKFHELMTPGNAGARMFDWFPIGYETNVMLSLWAVLLPVGYIGGDIGGKLVRSKS